MKKQVTSYLAGALTSALLIALPVSALAASGWMTIEVDPVNIQVNGEVFHPADANGNPVLVFACNGTTYAPVRALAEVYGLEVGYDSTTNMVTISQPTSTSVSGTSEQTPPAATVDFASQWTVTRKQSVRSGDDVVFNAVYTGPLTAEEFKAWWKSLDADEVDAAAQRMVADVLWQAPGCNITMYFNYNSFMLGQAGDRGGFTYSNFRLASSWVK